MGGRGFWCRSLRTRVICRVVATRGIKLMSHKMKAWEWVVNAK